MNINKIFPFKFWCQKVIPLVFDDSLSYYETLCKISDKLNEVIEQNNKLVESESELMEFITSSDFYKQISAYMNFPNGTLNSPYLCGSLPVPQYEMIGVDKIDDNAYDNLISLYDSIVAKNGATLEKIEWKDSNDNGLDEVGNQFYYYELTPTIYNKTIIGEVDGEEMPTAETTYIQSKTDNTIIISTGIHGDEKQSINTVYALTRFIASEDNPTALYLRNNIHFIIVPCVNPYGYNKNIRFDANDVNINRNFPTKNWSEFDGSDSDHKGTAPLSSRGALFLYSILYPYVTSNRVNGTVYLDFHDFEGKGNYGKYNSFATSNNIQLRKYITDVQSKIYNQLELIGGNSIKSARPFYILNFGTIPGSANWTNENGMYYSGLMENRLYLMSENDKYDINSAFISWNMISNLVMNCASMLVGDKAPFKDIVRLSDVNASDEDTVYQVANKMPLFSNMTFTMVGADSGTVLGQSLPTYNAETGVLRTSLVTLNKSFARGKACSIFVYDIYSLSTPKLYYTFVANNGSSGQWREIPLNVIE